MHKLMFPFALAIASLSCSAPDGAPACPSGCEATYYYDIKGGHWDCDPVDPNAPPEGGCQASH